MRKKTKQIKAIRLDQSSVVRINHFVAVFSIKPEQSIDEHMEKFNELSSVRQYTYNGDLNGGFDVLLPLAIYTC